MKEGDCFVISWDTAMKQFELATRGISSRAIHELMP